MKRKTSVRVGAFVLAASMTGCAAPVPADNEIQESSSINESYTTETTMVTEQTIQETTIPAETTVPVATTVPAETTLPTEPEIVQPTETPTIPDEPLNEAQLNSIAMLNYLTVLTQKINSSKNSRMFLEEAYAALINNTNPERVNEETESYLASLLDIIEKYRIVNIKRDRLQYIYEQNQAKAIEAAMPNPTGLLSAVVSLDLKRLAASAIYMSIDAYAGYKAYNAEINQEYLQENWELDDEEAANVHDSRKRAFMFMLEIVRNDQLPGELALNEKSVEEFVRWCNTDNLHQKLQFLEAEQATYEGFSNYWLELADCYYEMGQYGNCLEAAAKYREFQTDIFRKDYYWARTLPKIIAAAHESMNTQDYVMFAEESLESLLKNVDAQEWALRDFAAETYMDLYVKTKRLPYLEKAYEIVLNNVNNLVDEQRELNQTYISDVQEISAPEGATKDEKKNIKAYNKSIIQQRETELPPVYEPLRINCELLFSLAEKLYLSNSEKDRVDGILRGNGALFLNDTLEARYTFEPGENAYDAVFEKKSMELPAVCVNRNAVIRVTVTNEENQNIYEDWTLDAVERPDNDPRNFMAIYTSKKIKDQQWSGEATVKVEIFQNESEKTPSHVLQFKAEKYNSWWILPDSVSFEQVK